MDLEKNKNNILNNGLTIYIGERNFNKLSFDGEVNLWYKDEILDHLWEIPSEHTGIILWPRLDADGDFSLIMINILRESFSSWRVGSTEVCYSWDITKFYQSQHRSKTSFKKCGKYNQIFNQDNSLVQLPHKIFFDTEINDKYPTFLFFILSNIHVKENEITDEILHVLKHIKFSFNENEILDIQTDLKLEPFIEE